MPTNVRLRKVLRCKGLGACHEWTGAVWSSGYGTRMYKRRTWLAHRATWDEQVGPIPDGTLVLHRCDNRLCVRVDHLYLGSHQDNMNDMVRKGRNSDIRGEKNPHRTLSAEDVADIRSRYTGTKRGNSDFVSQAQLAAEYGVTQAHISKIIRNLNWSEHDG